MTPLASQLSVPKVFEEQQQLSSPPMGSRRMSAAAGLGESYEVVNTGNPGLVSAAAYLE